MLRRVPEVQRCTDTVTEQADGFSGGPDGPGGPYGVLRAGSKYAAQGPGLSGTFLLEVDLWVPPAGKACFVQIAVASLPSVRRR